MVTSIKKTVAVLFFLISVSLHARYYDPKLSRWVSPDPYISSGEYFPEPETSEMMKDYNKKLPGMGGVYNPINMNAYTYAADNPVKYIDPDGNKYIMPYQQGYSLDDRTIPTNLDDIVEKVNSNEKFKEYLGKNAACAQTAALFKASQMGEGDMSKKHPWGKLHNQAIDVINDSKATTGISLSDAKAGDIITYSRKEGANEPATGHVQTIVKAYKIFGLTLGFKVVEGHMTDQVNTRFVPSIFLNRSFLGWGHGITNFFKPSNLEFNSVRKWENEPTKHK